MTPIHRVVTVSVDADAKTASELCIRSGHTRLLVTEDSNPDRIRGVIHANSLLGLIVPESQPLDTLLAELRQTRNSFAVVVDEYGRTAGIVAIEDIVEEIVGEIADETDPSTEPVRRLADGQWLVQGDVPLGDLRDYGIALESDSDAYNSIGGLVLDTLGHVPKPGETLTVADFDLTVDALRGNRIEVIRVTRRSSAQPTGAGQIPQPSDP